MDKSKEYILMSEKANLEWIPQIGDFYYDKRFKRSSVVEKRDLEPNNIGIFQEFKNDFIPLLRQDQLQEMVEKENWIRTQVAFYDFLFETVIKVCAKCFNNLCLEGAVKGFKDGETVYENSIKAIEEIWKSFEQAWFAFVMKELYNKIWDGKEWIKNTQ